MKKVPDISPQGDFNAINDEIFIALFKRAAHEYITHDLVEDFERSEEFELSPEFEKRMQGMINKAIRKEKLVKSRKVLLKVAAGFVIFLALSMTVVFSAEALRVKIINMFINNNDDNTSITFSGEELYDEDSDYSIPGYMPDGYDMIKIEEFGTLTKYIFQNADGNEFVLNQYSGTPSISLDTDEEHGEILINGYDAFYSLANGMTSIVFKNDKYVFFLEGYVDYEEAFKFAENLN